jgi:TIR domain-containing protein
MAGGIFISYRRDDSRHAAGRLVDRLTRSFGKDRIFMDVDAIEPGLDFEKVINSNLAESAVLLAVIGSGWISAQGDDGKRRLDNPDDLVRLEIEACLNRGIRVIPVLVDGAQMPSSYELPLPLQALVRRQNITIGHETFGTDTDRLIATLSRLPGIAEGGNPDGKSAPSSDRLEFSPERLVEMTETVPADNRYVFKWPWISAQHEGNARSAARVPRDESIAVLVDLTVFGGARSAFMLGSRGWYYHYHYRNFDSVPKVASMSYDTLGECQIGTGNFWDELLGRGLVTVGPLRLHTGLIYQQNQRARAHVLRLLIALKEQIGADT